MSDRDQAQERTEQPSPRRLEKARRDGQVARSKELNTAVVMLAGGSAALFASGWAVDSIRLLMMDGFARAAFGQVDVGGVMQILRGGIAASLGILAPVMLGAVVAAIAGPVLLGGFTLSAEAMRPKLSRLSPLQGMRRIVSAQGAMELIKTLLKFSLLAGIAAALLWSLTDQILMLGRGEALDSIGESGAIIRRSFVVILSGLLVIALIDVPFVLWNHMKQLRMTRQELRDEQKETEGSPETRGRIRRIRQEMAGRRMMEEVPLADVVITNPLHYAVALRYTDRPDRAPRVVARGQGLVAARIREVAEEHGILVCESALLARAIYFNTAVGEDIPTGLYLAVARVLVWVMNVKAARRDHGPQPDFPTELPVPDEFVTEPRYPT